MSPRAPPVVVASGLVQVTVRAATLAEQVSCARGMAAPPVVPPPGSSPRGATGLLRSVQASAVIAAAAAATAPRGTYHRKGFAMSAPPEEGGRARARRVG